jgi:peptidoglycan/xylan/chitin deacetylase (PgdA/CDA1 family)
MIPAGALARIARAVLPALAAAVAAMASAFLLPAPWSGLAAVAVATACLGAVLLALDVIAPGVNIFSSALHRLPAAAGADAVALTFDDGPVEPFTREILDVLDAHGAKATFFCIGENIERHADLAREIVRRGHALGNHTGGHRLLPRLPVGQIEAEIEAGARAAERATGVRPRLLRCPKGYKGPRVGRVARRLGLPLIGFSYPVYDVENPPAARLVERVLGRVAPGDIILMHDGFPPDKPGSRSSLVEALPLILDGLRRRGLRPVAIDAALAGRLQQDS